MAKEREDLVYGRHPVLEALASGRPVDKVFLQQGTRGEFEKELRNTCKLHDVPFTIIPQAKLGRMTRGNHQGVIAQLAAAAYQKTEDLEVCGAHGIIIPQKNSAGLTPDAVKSSAGALLRLPVCREKSLVNTVKLLQMSGVKVIASDLAATKFLHELELTEPLCIVMGAEGEGISQGVARASDVTFKIPQAGTLNSFNVSVAAGILLFEAMKARM